jgi:SAM-dependent methyltransferase
MQERRQSSDVPPSDAASSPATVDEAYRRRLAAEKSTYANCLNVHDLPPIFHYWSNSYIRPKMETFGFSNPNQFFQKHLRERCRRVTTGSALLASIGSGNCDLEIELASHLNTEGHSFVIDCVDLNGAMLERGRTAAAEAGVSSRIHPVEADFNNWNPRVEYDAVIANQALHHVLKLEDLFAKIKACLKPHGCFVISDIIGCNGHERWPEALELVHEFWRKLPPSYRVNRQLDRYEELYENTSCVAESFEGIRSQDILPLLLERFHFEFFLGFANVIDPFVDRSFGHNFDAAAVWDRAFIDDVHRCDEEAMASGRVKPTHMLAVVTNDPSTPTIFQPPLSPAFSLRHREPGRTPAIPKDAYQWIAWPHSPQREVTIARRLSAAEAQLHNVQREVDERTAWAQRLDKQLDERTAWALGLEKDVQERTAWARRLEKELEERTAWALRLESNLRRPAWARWLDRRIGRLLDVARRLGLGRKSAG